MLERIKKKLLTEFPGVAFIVETSCSNPAVIVLQWTAGPTSTRVYFKLCEVYKGSVLLKRHEKACN